MFRRMQVDLAIKYDRDYLNSIDGGVEVPRNMFVPCTWSGRKKVRWCPALKSLQESSVAFSNLFRIWRLNFSY